jgi:hypothetical protein
LHVRFGEGSEEMSVRKHALLLLYNKWSGESPQHWGSVKPTKPAMLGMNFQG